MARPQKMKKEENDSDVSATDRALKGLQTATDKTTTALADGGSSLAKKAVRAARAGVPQRTVNLAISTVSEAMQDLREAVERAYAAPAERKPAERKSRVDLLNA